MKLFNSFAGAVMNKDLEVRLFPKSIYLDAKNVRLISPDNNNSRSVKLPLGNTAVTTLSLGSNAVSTGHCIDGLSNKIYWVVRSDSGSYVCEYDTDSQTESIVLGDNRGASTRVFNFPSTGNVEMRTLNDEDNGRTFLVIADGVGEPYYFEIEYAKTLPDNSFTLQNVSLIKAPPVQAPTLVLGNTVSSKENNIEAKFNYFAYRYVYKFGEISAFSPFSEFAFEPSDFSYDYSTGTNKSMFNDFSKVDISFNAGGEDVEGIEIIVKESGSNTAYVVQTFDKNNEGWSDNSTQTIEFSNSKGSRALEEGQLKRVFDNVPFAPNTVEIIGNRLIFGNYTEGYDLKDVSSFDVYPSFSLDYNTELGTTGQAHKQVKSNRDYEVAISYVDGKGRMTTPLTSEGNTVFVKNEDADKKNTLEVSISSNAPAWATGYRFFIKQSKNRYDVIAPINFYRDGVMAWIRIEGDDVNKIKEGDFLYVKSDTSGLKNSTIRTKVLEVSTQDRNFLETGANVDGATTFQNDGTYFRVEVDEYTLSESAVTNFMGSTKYAFRSSSTANNFENQVTYIESIYYDGVGLNDLSDNNNYTGTDDIRFEIQIDGTGSPNTFQWRTVNVSTDTTSAYTTGVSITGAAQILANGLQITFTNTTGHTLNDTWTISCKAGVRLGDWNKGGSVSSDGRRAIMLFESKSTTDESIKAGATITLTYDDSASGNNVQNVAGLVSETLTASSDYPNIEEWFYGDNIISQMTYPADVTDIIFRRGVLTSSDGQRMEINPSGRMYMAMLSQSNYTGVGGSEIRIDTSIKIVEFDNNIIFETIPIDENSEIFYELPYTYPTSGNNHIGKAGDTNQSGVSPAVINLDYFNSFGWYNGFESIKIGDSFNEKTMILDAKPLAPIENYKSIVRTASLTYSNTYESTTQFNGLNEFNTSDVNFKDLDTKYGSIQKLFPKIRT
ncbi:virion structural protein [Maribacter phage Panino]